MGELLGLRVGYSWLRDVWNREDWDSTIEAAFFGTYMNDVPKFNVLDQLFSVSVAHRVDLFGMPMQPGGQYAWDIVVLGDREFLRRHTLSLFTTLVENERHLTQVVARYQNKQFNETLPLPPKAEFRDADNWMAGFTHLLRFAEDQHYVKLGYQLDYDDTRGTNYEYLGSRFLVGGQYTLPWLGVRLKYDLDAHIRGYRHRNTLLPTTDPGSRRRQDEELTQIARVELPLRWLAIPGSSLFTDKSFTLAGEYQRTDARSNLAAFDYTRNVISLTLSWTY
jgi:hypothetical protein